MLWLVYALGFNIGSVWLGAVDQFVRPRGITVAGVSGVPSGKYVEGVVPSLVFRTTHSSPYPCSPRLASPHPLPLSLSSSGFAAAPPTFSSVNEIQDIISISRSKQSLTATVVILRSLLALSLSCPQTVRTRNRGRACKIQARGASLAD